jgi:hypothetical protein
VKKKLECWTHLHVVGQSIVPVSMLSVVRTRFSNLFIMQDSACFKKPGEMKEEGFKKCDKMEEVGFRNTVNIYFLKVFSKK